MLYEISEHKSFRKLNYYKNKNNAKSKTFSVSTFTPLPFSLLRNFTK